MMDPWGSMQNFLGQFRGFMRDPSQMMKKMGVSGNPDQIIQQMMGSGKLSQQQYNAARNAAERIVNNPQFQQMFNAK